MAVKGGTENLLVAVALKIALLAAVFATLFAIRGLAGICWGCRHDETGSAALSPSSPPSPAGKSSAGLACNV